MSNFLLYVWMEQTQNLLPFFNFSIEEHLKMVNDTWACSNINVLFILQSHVCLTLSARAKLWADEWRCSLNSVILPSSSLNAASFFKYTLHHSSCHSACCRPNHTCCNWPQSLEMCGLFFFLMAIGCTLIELKSTLTGYTKKKNRQFGSPKGNTGGKTCRVRLWFLLKH